MRKDSRTLAMIIALIATAIFTLVIVMAFNTDGTDRTNGEDVDLSIRDIQDERTFGDIKTHLFEIFNTKTKNAAKLSDGQLTLEEISKTMEEFLETSKYEVTGIGVVDNTFYIQQNTLNEVSEQMKVSIISLKTGFTASDWFKLTESIHNNNKVDAASLFSYKTDNGEKHYIYVYREKPETSNMIGINDILDTESNKNISN